MTNHDLCSNTVRMAVGFSPRDSLCRCLAPQRAGLRQKTPQSPVAKDGTNLPERSRKRFSFAAKNTGFGLSIGTQSCILCPFDFDRRADVQGSPSGLSSEIRRPHRFCGCRGCDHVGRTESDHSPNLYERPPAMPPRPMSTRSRARKRTRARSRTRKKDPIFVDGQRPRPMYVDYEDLDLLKKMVNRQGRIVGRRKSGCTAASQHAVTAAVKRARFMALLPYVGE